MLVMSASPQPGDGRNFITVCFSNALCSHPPLQKRSGVVKAQEKKERWKEKKVAKRQKKEDQEAVEEEENVQPVVDPLENGFLHHAEREQERMNERLLKKTYSKKNKMVSVACFSSVESCLFRRCDRAIAERLFFFCARVTAEVQSF